MAANIKTNPLVTYPDVKHDFKNIGIASDSQGVMGFMDSVSGRCVYLRPDILTNIIINNCSEYGMEDAKIMGYATTHLWGTFTIENSMEQEIHRYLSKLCNKKNVCASSRWLHQKSLYEVYKKSLQVYAIADQEALRVCRKFDIKYRYMVYVLCTVFPGTRDKCLKYPTAVSYLFNDYKNQCMSVDYSIIDMIRYVSYILEKTTVKNMLGIVGLSKEEAKLHGTVTVCYRAIELTLLKYFSEIYKKCDKEYYYILYNRYKRKLLRWLPKNPIHLNVLLDFYRAMLGCVGYETKYLLDLVVQFRKQDYYPASNDYYIFYMYRNYVARDIANNRLNVRKFVEFIKNKVSKEEELNIISRSKEGMRLLESSEIDIERGLSETVLRYSPLVSVMFNHVSIDKKPLSIRLNTSSNYLVLAISEMI